MAEITITIGDAWVGRILDAFDGSYPGRVVVDEETGEEEILYTKPQWAKRQVAGYVKDVIRSFEASVAADVARDESLEDTDDVEVS